MSQRIRWRPYRFSLASLMLVMTLAAVGSLWLREYAFRPQREAELLRQLQKRHGTGIAISYETGAPAGTEQRYSPVWWFTEQTPVQALEIRVNVRDMDARLFSTFTELRQVTIRGQAVPNSRHSTLTNEHAATQVYAGSYEEMQPSASLLTPQQWRDLALHSKVESLEIINQEVAIGHLEALAGSSSLRHLTIENGRLDNDDAAIIARMKRLMTLTLSGQQLDGTTLAPALPQFLSLHSLHLRKCPLQDEIFADIARMPALVWLDVSRTTITDQGIRHLSQSRSLEELSLQDTFVSYRASPDLAAMRSLKSLNLVSTGFDQAQLRELAAQAPHLSIECLVSNGRFPATVGRLGAPATGPHVTPAMPLVPAATTAAPPVTSDESQLPPVPVPDERPLKRRF